VQIHVSRISGQCIYAGLDNPNKFNRGDVGLLAQMYLYLSKSGFIARELLVMRVEVQTNLALDDAVDQQPDDREHG
jgi:hypothetical protein